LLLRLARVRLLFRDGARHVEALSSGCIPSAVERARFEGPPQAPGDPVFAQRV
jgi:hypothetical protein